MAIRVEHSLDNLDGPDNFKGVLVGKEVVWVQVTFGFKVLQPVKWQSKAKPSGRPVY